MNRSDRHGGAGLNSDRFSLKRAFRVLGDTHDARAIDVISKPPEKKPKIWIFFSTSTPLPVRLCREGLHPFSQTRRVNKISFSFFVFPSVVLFLHPIRFGCENTFPPFFFFFYWSGVFKKERGGRENIYKVAIPPSKIYYLARALFSPLQLYYRPEMI